MGQILSAIQLLLELVKGAKALFAYVEKAKDDQWFKDSVDTFKQLREAKTSDERKAAAVSIANLFGKL